MREDIAGPQGASSRPMWETLEGMVREKAQEFIQQIMEEAALGEAYDLGFGVLKDPALTHMWYNISSANGHESAGEVRDCLERDMTSAEISRATDLAHACMEADYRECNPWANASGSLSTC